MKAFIFDTETGGLDPHRQSLLSVGVAIMDLDANEVVETAHWFVKLPSIDDYVISDKAFEVHGITAEQAFNEGVTPEEIRDGMLDLWVKYGCTVAGGHNLASLDIPFVQVHLLEGQPFRDTFGYHILDSFPPLVLLAGTVAASGHTLEQARKAFKIDMSDMRGKAHDALYDAVLTARILCHLRKLLQAAREQEKNGELSVRS